LKKFFAIFTLSFLLIPNLFGNHNVHLWILEDSMHIYQPEDIIKQFPARFAPLEKYNLNFGLSKNEYWIIADIENTSEKEFNGRLVVEFALIKHLKLYEINGLTSRPIEELTSSNSHIFDISVPENTKKQYLLHVSGNGIPLIVPIQIENYDNVLFQELANTFKLGTFYGVIFFLLLIIIVVNLLQRNRFMRFLLFYTIVTILFFVFRDSLLSRLEILSSSSIEFTLYLAMLPMLIPIFEQSIKRYFKELESTYSNRKKVKALHLTSAVLILILLSGLFPPNVNFIIAYSYVLISIPIILGTLFNKNILTKFTTTSIVLALSLLFIGFAIDFLHKTGLIPNNFFTIQILKITYLLHSIIFLLGVFEKYKVLSQKTKLFNSQLTDLVKEKTAEINQQNEELKVQTEQLFSQKEELESQKEELQTQKEILEDQNKKLEILDLAASNTENVIYIFNPQGKLLWFNESFSSQLGMTFNEYIDTKSEFDIRDLSNYEGINSALDKVVSEEVSVTYESKIDREDKSYWFQTTLTPVKKENQLKYIVAIDSDISRLKAYEEQIIKQQQEFQEQKDIAISKRKEVELQQREITDSLNYAKRIQSAILPSSKSISRFFPESFVLFMPRDIVSGDFYWFHRIEDKYIYVVIDCTGHGVPGAFMSIIGTYLLNNIIIQNGETSPGEILKQLNRKLKISLKNTDSQDQTNDGMDVALVVVDKAKETLSFAGALRPLFLFQDNNFIEQKGDKIPITSAIAGNTMANFNEYTYPIKEGDSFYLFSDGIVDQFGGPKSKKFLTKRLKQVIFDSQMYKMEEQKRIIQKSIIDWKGKHPQVDDILMVGVKI
jgi:PAS domain S-box-containing protein